MEKACSLCYDLVLKNKAHTALKKISELKGSELYKCCCCYAYLHKHNDEWEIISGGEMPEEQVAKPTAETPSTANTEGSDFFPSNQHHYCQTS